MSHFTADQFDLLQRARDGLPMWGGSVAIERLRRDVDLLFALRLIEPDDAYQYRITTVGALVLEAHRLSPSAGSIRA